MAVRQASAQQINADGPEAGGRAVRQLSLLAGAALGCTLMVFAFMIIASLVAVSQVDAAGQLREAIQVSRATAAQPGNIDEITLAAIADTLDLDHARLATTSGLGSNEISVGIGGDRVVAWTPHRFGTMTFWSVAPARISTGIVFILIVAGIGWRVRVVGHQLDGRRAHAARQAATDTLTGLGNRLAFEAALAARSADVAAGGAHFLVMLADLDGLKAINDTHGHATGDAVLQTVARHLFEAALPDDVVARIGGDEFAVIRTTKGLDNYLADVRRRLASPLVQDGRPIAIGASFGVARSEDFGGAPSTLTQAADAALYRAKRSGGNAAEFAQPPEAPQRFAA